MARLVAIIGPTASGKSAMALELAQRFSGEIVAADSRTIYKGMDIGTAKPSYADKQIVPHHCIDMILPSQQYSVHEYKITADAAIQSIISRGNVPFLVGGSGLYIDAVLYNYKFPDSEPGVEVLPNDLASLQDLARELRYDVPEQIFKNPRHLQGFIRRGGLSGTKSETDALIIGVEVEPGELDRRIENRADGMLNAGFIQEVSGLLQIYGSDAPGFRSPGYRPFIDFLSSKISEQEARDLLIREHKGLAKRQKTWFKRNKDVHWVGSLKEAEQLVKEKLTLV